MPSQRISLTEGARRMFGHPALPGTTISTDRRSLTLATSRRAMVGRGANGGHRTTASRPSIRAAVTSAQATPVGVLRPGGQLDAEILGGHGPEAGSPTTAPTSRRSRWRPIGRGQADGPVPAEPPGVAPLTTIVLLDADRVREEAAKGPRRGAGGSDSPPPAGSVRPGGPAPHGPAPGWCPSGLTV